MANYAALHDSILLVTRDSNLANALGGIVHGALTSVGDLPRNTTLKGVIVDSSLATQGDFHD